MGSCFPHSTVVPEWLVVGPSPLWSSREVTGSNPCVCNSAKAKVLISAFCTFSTCGTSVIFGFLITLRPCAMSAKSAVPFARADSIVYRVTDSPRRIHAVDYVINLSPGRIRTRGYPRITPAPTRKTLETIGPDPGTPAVPPEGPGPVYTQSPTRRVPRFALKNHGAAGLAARAVTRGRIAEPRSVS